MARRRRKGNPLLTKIIVISLAAHAVALPILAHFGAFEKIRREFGTSKVVMVTVPPVEHEKTPPKAAKKAPKTPSAKKSGSSAPKAASQAHSNLPQPKIVASNAAGDGSGAGAVDAEGSGKAGVLPTDPNKVPGGGTANPNPAPPAPEPPKTEPPKPEPPKPEPPRPEPPKTEPPKVEPVVKPKKLVEAEAIEAPEPTIPDELRSEPFEKTLVVEADVDTGGHPINVKVVTGTGTKELDQIGLDTAKRYRFKPATLDDEPVQQHVRFHIVFKVE